MDYTTSNSYATDAGTGNRLHQDTAAVTTEVSALDMNQVIWSLMEIVKAAGLTGIQFDRAVPDTYQRLLAAVKVVASAPVKDVITTTQYREATFSGCACLIEI